MPIPNGGLITETNRQYYAGAQQFYIDAAGARYKHLLVRLILI